MPKRLPIPGRFRPYQPPRPSSVAAFNTVEADKLRLGLAANGDIARDVPVARITEAGVTQHEAALDLLIAQVSDAGALASEDEIVDALVAAGADIKNKKVLYPSATDVYDQSGAGSVLQSAGERTLVQVSFSTVNSPHFVTAAGSQMVFRADGSGHEASAAGLTFTLRLRIGSTDMSSHSYGGNQVVYSASADSSLDGGLRTFLLGDFLLASSIFTFPNVGVTQYAALTGQVTGGSGTDTANIADTDTKLVITGFGDIAV